MSKDTDSNALTAKQKKAYLKDSSKCPFCGSDNIGGDGVEIGDNQAEQIVTCNDCEHSWRDIYVLKKVEGIGE